MAKHICTKEIELTRIQDDVNYIKKVLTGNGEEGLIKQMSRMSDCIIRMTSYNHIKNWIMGSAITVLVSIVAFFLGYYFKVYLTGGV